MIQETPALKVESLSVTFDAFSLRNISFEVANGEYFVILGLSGAGKTLILESIAGMIKTDGGEIYLDGEKVTHRSIGDRKVGMMFQDYAIFPHLTVFSNIAYSLKSMGMGRQAIRQKVEALASDAGIVNLLKRKPGTLSGGELQRVALCRILAHDPDILLLDEPMSAMDVSKREGFQNLLREINRKGKTIIHITHDFHEAISLAHRIAVMEEGSLIQVGTPEEVFKYPADNFVARLSGVKNFFQALSLGNQMVSLTDDIQLSVSEQYAEGVGFVMIETSEIALSAHPPESDTINVMPGFVTDFHFTPAGFEVVVNAGVVLTATIAEASFRELNICNEKSLYASFKASAVKFILSER